MQRKTIREGYTNDIVRRTGVKRRCKSENSRPRAHAALGQPTRGLGRGDG